MPMEFPKNAKLRRCLGLLGMPFGIMTAVAGGWVTDFPDTPESYIAFGLGILIFIKSAELAFKRR